MAFLRWGLFSVLLTLLWWAPHAEVNSADGYHLEQAVVDAGVSSEGQFSNEEQPDTAVVPAAMKRFAMYAVLAYKNVLSAAFTSFLTPQQARAPPQGFAFNV